MDRDATPQVLLSALGTGAYVRCSYALNDTTSDVVNYVQTALTRLLFSAEPADNVRVLVACTDQARETNWEALKTEFARKELPEPACVAIPSGSTEQQLWEIFQTIVEKVPNDANLYLDVTHAYRSLPMVMTVLLQYLRLVKNITVGGVYYGAIEAVGTPDQLKERPEDHRQVPVFDLTPFVSLYDWSRAIDSFLRFGSAQDLTKLVDENIRPVLSETKGRDESASALRTVSESLSDFSENVKYVRGPELGEAEYRSEVAESIRRVRGAIVPPLAPVLDRLGDYFQQYPDADPSVPLHAVQWCLEHGMIQQGYTLLLEGIISVLAEKDADVTAQISDRWKRHEFVRSVLQQADSKPEEEWDGPAAENKDLARGLIGKTDKEFRDVFGFLRRDRNDMNHAGMREDHAKPAKLRQRLEERDQWIMARLRHMGYLS